MSRPTPAVLIVALLGAGVIIGRLMPPMLIRLDMTVPRIGWTAPLLLFVAAVGVGVFARSTWLSLHRRHERMTADHGIKMLSLAKSCAIVGAVVAGFYGGFAFAYLDALDSTFGKERFIRGLAAAVASTLLLVAGLLLERACRLPDDEDDEDGAPATP